MTTSSLENSSPLQKFLIVTTALIVVFAVLTVLAETTVRIRHYFSYGKMWGVEDTYRRDPESGLRVPIPGLALDKIHINSLGFRGPEIQMPKPASTIRIAFLGASTTYCAEVSGNEAVWPHIVVEELKRRFPGAKFDYINGGVPGYSVQSSIRNLEYRIDRLDPDVVIIYHGTNDLSKNTRRLAKKAHLVAQNVKEQRSWLANQLLLWRLAEKNFQILLRQSHARSTEGKLALDAERASAPFEADLRELVARSQRRDRLVAVATFSTRLRHDQSPDEQTDAAVSALYYMPYMTIDGLLDGFDAYNRSIRRVAAEAKAYLIGGENDIPGDAVHFNDSVHFTDAGSRVMADRVGRALTRWDAFRRLVDSKREPAG